jgi:hypothetical protein
MNINDSFPSKYLKASDLGGRQVTVKIDRVELEEVGRDKEQRPILYFVGKQKGCVLNKTNANKIASAYGQDTEDWTHRALILFEAMVDYAGDTVPAIRIKVPPAGDYRSPSRQDPPAQERRTNGNGQRDDRSYENRRESTPRRPPPDDRDLPDRHPEPTDAELDDSIPF